MFIYQSLLPCPASEALDGVFNVYMQQEDKEIMTLRMTAVKQHSQHIMTPTITICMTVVK
jgi:hypothetical protein